MSNQYLDLNSIGEALKQNLEVSVLTSGVSMRPMLRQHRDIVVIERVNRELKKGDVVAYPGGKDKYTLHRIIKIKNGNLIIRGDNNYFTEKNVKREDIVGILKEFYRDGKYINCKTNKRYRVYTVYILSSYPLRYFWCRKLKPFLARIKHFLLKSN